MWPVHTDIPGKLTYWEHSCWTQGCLKSSKQVHNLLSGSKWDNFGTSLHEHTLTTSAQAKAHELISSEHRIDRLRDFVQKRCKDLQGNIFNGFQRMLAITWSGVTVELACHQFILIFPHCVTVLVSLSWWRVPLAWTLRRVPDQSHLLCVSTTTLLPQQQKRSNQLFMIGKTAP